MKFTLFTANCTGVASNCEYPNRAEITNKKELVPAVSKDQVFAEYKGNYRSKENFIRSDVIPLDCDNDHSEKPEEWLTREMLEEIFSDVDHVIFPSRHNMLPKNGKAQDFME